MTSELMYVTVWGMGFATIVFAIAFIGTLTARNERKSRDGSYGLSQAKNKAKADIIANDTLLKLNAAQVKPGYENVHVERE